MNTNVLVAKPLRLPERLVSEVVLRGAQETRCHMSTPAMSNLSIFSMRYISTFACLLSCSH